MKRQEFIKQIGIAEYGIGSHPKPSLNVFNSKQHNEIERVYRQLGGILPEVPYRFRGYDIQLKDFIIELDEEQHFNRYRLITLKSPIYKDYRNFNVENYKEFCKKFEHNCRTDNNFWSSSSTEKQFGLSNITCNVEDIGASRWKQRAFYDFIKDLYSKIMGIPIIRISIYDTYGGMSINSLIGNDASDKLLEYIKFRYENLQENA